MDESTAQAFTLTEASRKLDVDPKTLHRHCQILGISPFMVSSNGRIKLFSQAQIEQLGQVLQGHYPNRQRDQERLFQNQIVSPEREHIDKLSTLMERLFALECEIHGVCELIKANPLFAGRPTGVQS